MDSRHFNTRSVEIQPPLDLDLSTGEALGGPAVKPGDLRRRPVQGGWHVDMRR